MKLWSKRIYADAAAATPLSPSVKRELVRLFELYGNPGALHKEAVAANTELEKARASIAETLGAHAYEIIFAAGGTEANNIAIFGVLKTLLHEGEQVHAITSATEHSSILEPLRALVAEGLELTELPVDSQGLVDPKKLREAIKENTVFVSIQMVNSEIGTIQNIRELAKEIRHQKKSRAEGLPLYFHTDASQAPLWLKLNVEKLGIDLMTLDAQKILGPKGAGVLFARRGTELAPYIYGGGQEGGLRSGTENVAYAGALAIALKEAQYGCEKNIQNISKVRDVLLNEIKKLLPGVSLNGAGGEARVANNINISIPKLNGDMAVIALDAEGVAVSTRSACDTEDEAPSHVLNAIGLSVEDAKNSIRITFLPDATEAQARRIAKNLFEIASRYRQVT
jgi:cysteine desulfurase